MAAVEDAQNGVRSPVAAEAAMTYIDVTMQSIACRPALWGPLGSLELQVIRLLEVRAVLRGRSGTANAVSRAYGAFVARKYPRGAPLSMWTRIVEDGGDERDYGAMLREFIDEQRHEQDGKR